jgi:HD domain
MAGIAIPNSGFAREATELLRDTSTRLLFDHSRRVFLSASLQAEQLDLDYNAELLHVGAMFHDVGPLEGHRSEHERCEIDGANAARAFLERHGLPEEQVMTGWQSIALHTTRQVPNYLEPEARLVALGVQYDVLGSRFGTLTAEQRDGVLAAHPRTGFKTGMIEALSAGVRDKPKTAVGTMLTDILEATLLVTYGRTSATRSTTPASRRDAPSSGVVIVYADRSHNGHAIELARKGVLMS